MIRRLFFGCFFAHGTQIRERDQSGRLSLRCDRCGSVHVPDLRIDGMEKGPLHRRPEILGTHDYRVRTSATKSKTLQFGR